METIMKISVNNVNPAEQSSDCLLLGIFEQAKMSDAASQLDKIAAGYIARVLKQGDMDGKTIQLDLAMEKMIVIQQMTQKPPIF